MPRMNEERPKISNGHCFFGVHCQTNGVQASVAILVHMFIAELTMYSLSEQ